MGKMSMLFGVGFTGLAQIIILIGFCLPYHQASFFLASVIKGFSVTTKPLFVYIDSKHGDACQLFRSFYKMKICDDKEEVPLQQWKDRVCADVVKRVSGDACEGYGWAYTMGILLSICVFVDLVLQSVSVYMIYSYFTSAPKRKLRENAMTLTLVGTVVLLVVLLLYFPAVILNLDNVRFEVSFGALSKSDNGHGTAPGYYITWLGLCFKVAVCVLYARGKTNDERRYADAREQMEFEAEMSAAGQNQQYGQQPFAPGPYGGGGYAASMPAQYGQQGSYGQPAAPAGQYGGWGSTTAPPPGWGGMQQPQAAYGQQGYGQQGYYAGGY